MPRLEPRPILGANCWVTYADRDGSSTIRYQIDAEGHPVRSWTSPGARLRDWTRRYEADGDLAEIVVSVHGRTSTQEQRWSYADGRLTESPYSVWEWYEDGRVRAHWGADDVWRARWDADGHLVAEVTESYHGFGSPRTEWSWDGDRLLGRVTTNDRGPFERVEWDRWDGDLPAHGTFTLYEGTDSEQAWEERWEWQDDGRPTLHTSTRHGSERVVGAWTYDGARLLEAEGLDWRATWTWDDAGRVVAREWANDDVTAWSGFSWDGDTLIEARETRSDGWSTVRQWAGACPEAVQPRSRIEDPRRDGDPFPYVDRHLPQEDEPW